MQIAEKEVKGAVYSLVEFNGKVLAGINSTVRQVVLCNSRKGQGFLHDLRCNEDIRLPTFFFFVYE